MLMIWQHDSWCWSIQTLVMPNGFSSSLLMKERASLDQAVSKE
jgi:hypothetical protein